MVNLYIGGEYVASNNSNTQSILNPATNEVIAEVPIGSAADVDKAVAAASAAFDEWWATPASRRGEIIYEAGRAVLEHIDDLAKSLVAEQGKPLREGRLEIHRFVHTLDHYAGLSKNLRGGYVPNLDANHTHGIILKRPLGVCAAIVPWNFPVALMGNKLAPALVTGNTMVVKPAPTTPVTTLRVAEIMTEAGLPPGCFNVVTGGADVGQALIQHPDVRKVGFTGSTATGKKVMSAASEGVKRVTLELGGSDPMIICDDANIDRAVSAASVGRFFNCGQACLAIKRVFVFDAVADEFIEKLQGKVQRLKVGPGMAEGTQLGPLHSTMQRDLIADQVADAVSRGATVLEGGYIPEEGVYAQGNYYMPTLLADVDPEARVAREEVFGPALPIWRVADLDDALERANSSIYGLGSSVWTRDIDRANYAATKLESGYTWINSPQKIYDELPFGGFKQSGIGQEHGMEALDHYMATKSVVVKHNV